MQAVHQRSLPAALTILDPEPCDFCETLSPGQPLAAVQIALGCLFLHLAGQLSIAIQGKQGLALLDMKTSILQLQVGSLPEMEPDYRYCTTHGVLPGGFGATAQHSESYTYCMTRQCI